MEELHNLEILSEAEVDSGTIALKDILLIYIPNQVYGPYYAPNLENIIHKSPTLFKESLISSLADSQWVPLFEFPLFQKRSEHTTIHPLEGSSFKYLLNGQIMGPFPMEKLEDFVHNKTLSYGTDISMDNCHTWHKVYQIDGFDRRQEKLTPPVNPPEIDLLSSSQKKILSNIKVKIKGSDVEDSQLVMLAKARKKKEKNIEEGDPLTQFEQNKGIKNTSHRKYLFLISFLLVGVLALGAFGIFHQNSNEADNKKIVKKEKPFINKNENQGLPETSKPIMHRFPSRYSENHLSDSQPDNLVESRASRRNRRRFDQNNEVEVDSRMTKESDSTPPTEEYIGPDSDPGIGTYDEPVYNRFDDSESDMYDENGNYTRDGALDSLE